jgi:hypothetical protein
MCATDEILHKLRNNRCLDKLTDIIRFIIQNEKKSPFRSEYHFFRSQPPLNSVWATFVMVGLGDNMAASWMKVTGNYSLNNGSILYRWYYTFLILVSYCSSLTNSCPHRISIRSQQQYVIAIIRKIFIIYKYIFYWWIHAYSQVCTSIICQPWLIIIIFQVISLNGIR